MDTETATPVGDNVNKDNANQGDTENSNTETSKKKHWNTGNATIDELLEVLDKMADMDKCVCSATKFMYDGISSIYHGIHPDSMPLLQSGSMAEGCAIPKYIHINEMEMDIMSINFDETGWLGTTDVPGKPGYVYIPVDRKKLAEYETIQEKHNRPSYDDQYNFINEFPYTCLSDDKKFVSPRKRREDVNNQRIMNRESKVAEFFSEMFIQLTGLDNLTLVKIKKDNFQTNDAKGDTVKPGDATSGAAVLNDSKRDVAERVDGKANTAKGRNALIHNITKASVEEEVRFHRDGYRRDFRVVIDSTASMAIDKWPEIAKEWVDRKRVWPLKKEIQRIAAMGCHVVPKTSPNGDPDKEWRYSFSNAELELIRLQSEEYGLRRLYLLFKLIYYKYIKSIIAPEKADGGMACVDEAQKKPGLRSYSLKTTMLFFCEQHSPSEDLWKDENIFKGIRMLFETFKGFIDKGVLHNYFIASQNIFSGVPKEELTKASEIIETILCNLEKFMPDMIMLEEKLNENALLKEMTNAKFIGERIETGNKLLKKAARVMREIFKERTDIHQLVIFLEQNLGSNVVDVFKGMGDDHLDFLANVYKKVPDINLAFTLMTRLGLGNSVEEVLRKFQDMNKDELNGFMVMVNLLT